MFPFRVLSRRWRRISAVILGNAISVKYLPFSREFEDLTWNTEFYRGCGKTCQCSSSPFHREEGPGGLHLGAVGPVGLPWSSAGAAVSRSQCPLAAAAAAFYLHWCRHFFDHIWIICCLRGSIVHHLFFSKPRHCVIWPKPGGNHILARHFYVLPNLLHWSAFKARLSVWLAECQKSRADHLLDAWLVVKCQGVVILTCKFLNSNMCIRTLALLR